MNKIPRSSWVLQPVYFSVVLVEDFEPKYKNYLKTEGVSEEDISSEYLTNTITKWLLRSEQGNLELYQFPQDTSDSWKSSTGVDKYSDYFEREDNDWVIPRHLFEVL